MITEQGQQQTIPVTLPVFYDHPIDTSYSQRKHTNFNIFAALQDPRETCITLRGSGTPENRQSSSQNQSAETIQTKGMNNALSKCDVP